MLKLKDAPEKVTGSTALTPTEWAQYLVTKPGEYVVVGTHPGADDQVTLPWDREAAQRIFDGVVEAGELRPACTDYRLRIVRVYGGGRDA